MIPTSNAGEVELTLGLAKKNEPNDLVEYKQQHENNKRERLLASSQMQKDITQNLINEMKTYPELYFNFGFTYEDFKAYLMKLMYCRSMRSFIEKKRVQRIDEFN